MTPRKCNIGFFPTPIHELKRLTQKLGGPKIFIKRDDLTGLAFGGNKTRKLEFFLGEALNNSCDSLITAGAIQSNHCRQTAAAAAMSGLECYLLLGGEEPEEFNGNLLLDKLLGAKIYWSGKSRKGEKLPEIYEQLKNDGKNPYLIPYGGSNVIGAFGFVEAVKEIKEQVTKMNLPLDHIIFSSSSGGTHAGLTVGKFIYSLNSNFIGIQIDKGEAGDIPFLEHVLNLCNETAKYAGIEKVFSKNDISLKDEFMDADYGVVTQREQRAIKLLAELEGVLLDPVYTGRAFGALIDMIEKKEFSSNENILFWHTGGSPAIFNYSNELLRKEI